MTRSLDSNGNAPRNHTDSAAPRPASPPLHDHLANRWSLWLAGVGADVAGRCTKSELLKLGAIGFTVLVPTLLALFSAGYTVSLLTSNAFLIGAIAIGWAFIVLTIDRGIVATLRESLPVRAKVWQFILRLAIAGLMALTISHPLTLLLFQSTVQREVERTLKEEAAAESIALGRQIHDLDNAVSTRRQELDIPPATKFETAAAPESQPAAAGRARLAELRTRERDLATELASALSSLERANDDYALEVNGNAASGRRGPGPISDNIKLTRITPLTETVDSLRTKSVQVAEEIRLANRELDKILAAERTQLAAQREQFLAEQTRKRQELETEVAQLRNEADRLKGQQREVERRTQDAIAAMQPGAANRVQPDILTQTMALHSLFEDPERGGHFALVAFLALFLLFMGIDTTPIVVKFITKRGEYDEWIDFHHDLAVVLARNELAAHNRRNAQSSGHADTPGAPAKQDSTDIAQAMMASSTTIVRPFDRAS